MSKQKEEKTNVMRILDRKRVPYTPHTYPVGDAVPDGVTVARMLGQDPSAVFKTLVARGASGGYYVFDIPVADTLDLKKAATTAGAKKAELIPIKELLPLTGYIRGGCTPIGMKKPLPIFFHRTATDFDHIFVSAGVRGLQLKINPSDLIAFTSASTADLVK